MYVCRNSQSVSRQVHDVFQIEFSTECKLMFPLSIYSIISSLRSYSSCLSLLPRRPMPSIFCPIFNYVLEGSSRSRYDQSSSPSFFVFSAGYSFPAWLSTTPSFLTIGQTDLLHPSPAPHFIASQAFPIYFPQCASFSTVQGCAPNIAFSGVFLRIVQFAGTKYSY